jgi:hypothetical protein
LVILASSQKEGADSKTGGRRTGGRRWERRGVGGWETEGREVGKEKFAIWEKTDPPKQNVSK